MTTELDGAPQFKVMRETSGSADFVVRDIYRKSLYAAKVKSFWWGFLAGMIVLSAMNIGDVHLCMGECDSAGFAITDIWQEAQQ